MGVEIKAESWKSEPKSLTAASLSGGVFVSTLTPFDSRGFVFCESVTDQARRIACIGGIKGIAVNTAIRERQSLSAKERLDVIRCTAKGLKEDQLLLAGVGQLADDLLDEVLECAKAGADAVVAFPAPPEDDDCFEARIAELAALVDCLALPVIATLGQAAIRWTGQRKEIIALACKSQRILGFDMGADDDVRRYDQDYYALKSIDRPLACLSSSEGALFHNLNTGGDGVLSSLAYIAPHEIAALYQATRNGDFPLAQALHNRLAPLVSLLDGRDIQTREMIYRQTVHIRGLLSSPDARGLPASLNQDLLAKLQNTLDNIALKPISWV